MNLVRRPMPGPASRQPVRPTGAPIHGTLPASSGRIFRRRAASTAAGAAAVVVHLLACLPGIGVFAAELDFTERIAIETFSSLREVERYQLKVAEKFYLQGEYAIALDEYDKFLTLYESSPAAPYAQLMWSHCQRRLRMVNTAIREGYQSVVDYWPDTPEAVLSRYLIADSYRSVGEIEKAKPAYQEVLRLHPDHFVAVHSKSALLAMARTAGDEDARRRLLRDLTFDTPRTDATRSFCIEASRELAALALATGDYDSAAAAVATSYPEPAVLNELVGLALDPIRRAREAPDSSDDPRSRLAARLLAELENCLPDSLDDDDQSRAAARAVLYQIASIQSAAGDDAAVLATYLRSGKLLGEDDPLRDHLAEWHKARGERAAAATIYRRFDDATEGRRRLVGMLREDGNWTAAIDACQELLRLDPDRASEYRWWIAECQESAGRLREAIAAFRKCESFPAAHFRMASCHRRLMEHDEALTLYRQVKAASAPDAPEADLQIARTLEAAGRRDQAIKAFQLTCKSHPKSPQASQAHAHLQDQYGISITLGGAKEE